MNLDQRTEALLALVESYRSQRQAEILGPARAQARDIVRTAHGEARRRVHIAVLEARERQRTELARERAALQTLHRTVSRQWALLEIARAWQLLHEELLRRWQTPELRERWTAHHLRSALSVLPMGAWEIVHAPEWLAQERACAFEFLRTHGITSINFVADLAMGAGLRIACRRNVVDASLDGLLADRVALEGEILRLLATANADKNSAHGSRRGEIG